MEKKKLAVEITESGSVKFLYKTPDGDVHFISEKLAPDGVWKTYDKPAKGMLNVMCVETFYRKTYPVMEVKISEKPGLSWLYKWWWKGCNKNKLYDISTEITGYKTVTALRLFSGAELLVDEDISVFENALNGS